MTREFQVLFMDAGRSRSEAQVARVHFNLEPKAREFFEEAGFAVLAVSEVRVVLAEGQCWFRLEEAAEYLRCSVSKVHELCGEGRLAKARNGDPWFSKGALDKVASEGLGKALAAEFGVESVKRRAA